MHGTLERKDWADLFVQSDPAQAVLSWSLGQKALRYTSANATRQFPAQSAMVGVNKETMSGSCNGVATPSTDTVGRACRQEPRVVPLNGTFPPVPFQAQYTRSVPASVPIEELGQRYVGGAGVVGNPSKGKMVDMRINPPSIPGFNMR